MIHHRIDAVAKSGHQLQIEQLRRRSEVCCYLSNQGHSRRLASVQVSLCESYLRIRMFSGEEACIPIQDTVPTGVLVGQNELSYFLHHLS